MENTRLTKQIFVWDNSKCRNNWSYEVKKGFADIGNIVAFQSSSLVNFGNPRHFLQEVKLKLLDKYKHRWKNDIDSQSKLSLLYIHIKREISVEHYVSMNMSKHLRSLLTQLRSGTLPLDIETGRYYGTTREHIICKQCHRIVIDNEQHFYLIALNI